MFVVLIISKREAKGHFRLLKRVGNMLKPPKMYLKSSEYMGGHFALLQIETSDKPDWQAVERICGPFAGRILFQEGVSAPDGYKLNRPLLPRFNSEVVMRTACGIIDMTKLPMYRRMLGLVDFNSAHVEMLATLLRHFTSVNVVTSNPGIYEKESLRVMEELGAPVIISSELKSLRECAVVISPSSVFTSQEPEFECPVISSGAFVCSGHVNLISNLIISPEKELLDACPAGISAHEFCGALFEFCGIQPSSFFAEDVLYDNKPMDIGGVARIIIRAAGFRPEDLI